MKESRLGEWGNNVTRLLYYLTDIDNQLIDMYEYKAPRDLILQQLAQADFILYTQESTSVDEYFIAYIAGWEVPDVNKLIALMTNAKSKHLISSNIF